MAETIPFGTSKPIQPSTIPFGSGQKTRPLALQSTDYFGIGNASTQPTTGSAGQTVVPGSNLSSNIAAIPGAFAGAGKAFGDLVTGGFGEDLAAPLIAKSSDVQNAIKASQANDATDVQFIQNMQARQKAGQQLTPSQQQLYNSILSKHSEPTTEATFAPEINKSNEQILGDAGTLALNILSAGTYGTEGLIGKQAFTTGLQEATPTIARALEAAPATGRFAGFAKGAVQGAKAGAPLGAAYGAAGAMQQNQSAGGVVGSSLFGALTGAAGAAAVGGTIGAIRANPSIFTNYDSAIKDVTPEYDQLTPKQKGQMLPQTQEGGLLTGRKIVPGQSQESAAAALASMDNYNPSATSLEKWQAANETITKEADQLANAPDLAKAVIPKKQIVSTVKDAINTAAENSLTLQNTDPIVTKYINAAQKAAAQNDGTLAGALNVRKELDAAYKTARGGMAFNDTRINALDEIHQAGRDALNNLLIENAPNTNVKLSLQYQSALYRAQDALQTKAVKESGSTVGRLYQAVKKHPFASGVLGTTGLEVALHKLGII